MTPDKPLSEAELDRLEEFLGALEADGAMNIEELDGFFSALIVGPELVMPSEYLPLVLGSAMTGLDEFESEEQAEEILSALVRHWNAIARTLNDGKLYYPLLLKDDEGLACGNDWALGFLRGVDIRRSSWRQFMDDDEQSAAIIPMFALAHEHDPDPGTRFESPTPEKREELIRFMIVGLTHIHEYFRARRESAAADAPDQPIVHSETMIGRNDPCPCGSGKNYKECCGAMLH